MNVDRPVNVLIIAGRADFHAQVVQYAMRQKGHNVALLASDDFSCSDSLNIEADSTGVKGFLDLAGSVVALESIDVVWNRRWHEPVLPEEVAAADRAFAREELAAGLDGIYRLLDHARWVNPLDAIARSENKVHQLRCAVEAGLSIPDTLISSNAPRISKFLRDEPDCIYKSLNGYVWHEAGGRRATYTAAVCLDDLPSEVLLRAVPGIYQRLVKKKYEVRAQFFGRNCAAIRIEASGAAAIDWRLGQSEFEGCDPIAVPASIQANCLALMARLGIVNGAFDFIVQPDGRWIFLEVNQAGQFLFLEQWCPRLPVLDMFCALLERPSMQFVYAPLAVPIRFADAARSSLSSEAPA